MTNQRWPTVELIGHAGAGKTRLLQDLTRRLRERGISCEIPGPLRTSTHWGGRRIEDVSDILRSPVRAYNMLAILAKQRRLDQTHLSLMISAQARLRSVRAAVGDGVLLMDEGPWHALWSLTLELPSQPNLNHFFAIFRETPMPDIVVSIRISPARSLEQLRSKENSHRLSFNPAAKQLLEKQDFVLDQMEHYLEEQTTLVKLCLGLREDVLEQSGLVERQIVSWMDCHNTKVKSAVLPNP